jgi:hypothetical protein
VTIQLQTSNNEWPYHCRELISYRVTSGDATLHAEAVASVKHGSRAKGVAFDPVGKYLASVVWVERIASLYTSLHKIRAAFWYNVVAASPQPFSKFWMAWAPSRLRRGRI